MRTLGEKALQQVDAALQGGQQCQQQAGAGIAFAPPPGPRRSQADADLAMQMLLVSLSKKAGDHRWRFLTDRSPGCGNVGYAIHHHCG